MSACDYEKCLVFGLFISVCDGKVSKEGRFYVTLFLFLNNKLHFFIKKKKGLLLILMENKKLHLNGALEKQLIR